MGLSRIALILGDGYFGEDPYIVTEYIEWSIEDYLEK
jgi:hypothetical protein